MLMSRRSKERKAIYICIINSNLEQVDEIKYLGIIINNKFKFKE
jgi:hypothetical protein